MLIKLIVEDAKETVSDNLVTYSREIALGVYNTGVQNTQKRPL